MREFVLTDASHAGQLFAFRDFCVAARDMKEDWVRLRIRLVDAFKPTAWYWHDVLKAGVTHGVTLPAVEAVLEDGCVQCLPALIVWCGATARHIESATVTTQGGPGSGVEFDKTVRALAAPMCFTEREEREGLRRKTATEWLTHPRILTPDVLRRHYWMPPDVPAPASRPRR
ncbi:MAG: hypothetical protein AAB554_04055 [Patescibacteria group bacterium]